MSLLCNARSPLDRSRCGLEQGHAGVHRSPTAWWTSDKPEPQETMSAPQLIGALYAPDEGDDDESDFTEEELCT